MKKLIFIFVSRFSQPSKKYVQKLRKFGKTRIMSDELKSLLEEAFKYTDELFTIKY